MNICCKTISIIRLNLFMIYTDGKNSTLTNVSIEELVEMFFKLVESPDSRKSFSSISVRPKKIRCPTFS